MYQTPCHNRCLAILALQSGADRVRLQGLRAKKAYLAAGAKLNRYNAKVPTLLSTTNVKILEIVGLPTKNL